MSKLKQMLQDRVVGPANHSRGGVTTVAQVDKSDDINNICSIHYIDKDGFKRNKDNVPVRIYGSGGDWFPAVNDFVVVEDNGDTVVITARHVSNFNTDVRSKLKLTKDVHSDQCGGSTGGMIF